MANQLITSMEVTNYQLMVLANNALAIPHAYRDLDSEFGKKGDKIGDTIYVRKPNRGAVRDGAGYSPSPMIDTTVPISIDQQTGADFEFTTAEMYLSLDEIGDRYIAPRMESLANTLDSRFLRMCMLNTPTVFGVPGTNPGDSGTNAFRLYANALAYLKKSGTPAPDVSLFFSSDMGAAWEDYIKNFYHPERFINAAWNGQVSDALGMKWYEDNNIAVQTIGILGGTPAVNGAGQTGTTITLSGCTPNVVNYYNVGDSISFATVFQVNVQPPHASFTNLKNFSIQAPASTDGAGNVTVTIYPALQPTGVFQNVSNSPPNGALVSVYNTNAAGQGALSGLNTTQAVLFAKQAFAFVSFPGHVPTGFEHADAKKSKKTGLSIRWVMGMDLRTDTFINRSDVYWGSGPLYGDEMSVRVAAQ